MSTRKCLLLLGAAWLCAAAAPAKSTKPAQPPEARSAAPQSAAPKSTAPKSTGPKSTAHKPPAPSAAAAGAIDARDPAGLIALLASLNAKGEVGRHEGDAVFVTVTSPTEIFSAQFAGCDAQGRACQALLFDRLGQAGSPTPLQINAFNQSSVMCRVYQDKTGKPHVVYSTLLFGNTGRNEMLMHINAWRGCISDFNEFLKDPNGFLAQAA